MAEDVAVSAPQLPSKTFIRRALRQARRGVVSLCALAAAFGLAPRACEAQRLDLKQWASSPYKVHATVAVDASRRPQPNLAAALARHLAERVEATLTPLWTFELAAAKDAQARRFCLHPAADPPTPNELPDGLQAFDKLLFLGVETLPAGFVIRCREFDAFTGQWGPSQERRVSQSSFVDEACFQLLADSFSPLALVEAIPDNPAQVRLLFKGSELPRRAAAGPLVTPGRLLEPLLRRTDRTGRVIENGVQPVPWTLLTAAPEADGQWLATVHSGMRLPFGMRRGAFVQQLAIARRYAPGPARVRFHARSDRTQPLAGYEVFRSLPDGGTEPIGVTDRDGTISVPPGDGSVAMLLLRSDGQLLAKLPAASGAPGVLEAPISDNAARLRAQSEARVVREELIDVVARRAILAARVRAMLKENRQADAAKIMVELDALPTTTTFGRALDAAAQRIPDTGDARVKQAIDKMFSTTREMLGKFLNPRQITELQSEVNAAGRGGS